ncbi:MAG TPA: glycosyltransferase family 2 protein [Pyrinomonadaceae bacterium]|jgi:glycosyltransferase involved in cell wall biosynthesis
MTLTETKKRKVVKLTGRSVKPDAPKVSVIIPAYNIAGYIGEALDSVLAQTFQDFEIIVINDGSPDTDEFEKVLEKYFDEIIYLKQENAGCGPARNVAIEHARGSLLAFLDGDDAWLSEFLESQVKFLEVNDYDLVYADALLFGGSVLDGRTFMQNAPSEGEANFESLLDMRCNVIISGSVARRKAVIDAGLFEWKDARAQDFNLWLRMAHRGARVGYQKTVLLKYRIRAGSLSGSEVQRVEREINAYERISAMIKLNDSERKIVEKQLKRLEAELEIERGKTFLLQEDFVAARKAFEKANAYRQSPRLKLIIRLTQIAPRLLLKIYRARRKEFFVPAENKR